MFRFFQHATKTVAIGAVVLVFGVSTALAAFTAPGLVKDINGNIVGQQDLFAADPNAEGPNFSPGDNVFASPTGVPYTVDTSGALNGNDLLVVTQGPGFSSNSGAGFTLSVSNGENGVANTYNANPGGPAGTNPSNTFNAGAPDSAFTTIGNSTGRLEDGNVVRFSTWVRNDPLAPTTTEPQIVPIVKLEFWRDALSGDADFTGGVTNPSFGSRIFDTDQNDVAITDPAGRKRLLDINGDGFWFFGSTTEPAPLTTTWQQIVHTYEVDSLGLINGDTPWDILDTAAAVETVADVEEIRGVMFVGDFAGGNFPVPENLLWDNALIEIFGDTTAEGASNVLVSNPSPLLDEVTEDADFDGDGDVTGNDFLIWQRGFGTGTTQPEGDANFSGGIDSADLAIWESQFGPGPLAALSAVPEPSSALLVLFGVLCFKGTSRQSR